MNTNKIYPFRTYFLKVSHHCFIKWALCGQITLLPCVCSEFQFGFDKCPSSGKGGFLTGVTRNI